MAPDSPRFDAAVPPSRLALPARSHVPGSGSQPDWPVLEAAKATVPSVTDEAGWAANDAYVYGFALLRGGYYWEAHEVWEPVWLACPPNGRARTLLRGLIQTANAHLKAKMVRPRAVIRLVEEARIELAGLRLAEGETFMGVTASALLADLAALAGSMTQTEGASPPRSPVREGDQRHG